MEDRIRSIEDRLERLEARVGDLATRVEALAAGRASGQPGTALGERTSASSVTAAGPWSLHRLPIQFGRLFLVMAGAFGLRAVTLSGAVLDAVGVGVGLAYAALWIGFADVAGRRGRASDAAFHAAAVAAIAYPLLWEAATRFAVLGPVPVAILVLGFTAALMAVAWRRRLPVVAWTAVLAGSASGTGLTFAVRDPLVAGVVLFPVAAMTLHASTERADRGARWPAALALDAVGWLMAWLAGRPNQEWLDPTAASTFLLGLAGFYLAAFAWSAMARRRRVGVFTMVQSVLAIGVGFEGGLRVLPAGQAPVLVAGLAVGVVAVAAAVVSLPDTARRPGQAWSAAVGSWFVVRCTAGLLPIETAGMAWGLLALVLAATGRPLHRAAHRLLAASLALAAGVPAGLWTLIVTRLGKASGPIEGLGVAPVSVVAGWTALTVLWWRRPPEQRSSRTWTGPGLVLALATSLAVAAFGVAVAVRAAGESLSGDPAAMAVVATAVLVAVSVSASGLARVGGRPEWRWTAVTLLVAAACKVLAQDLPRGRPATLFASLALVGGGLLAAARLLRRGS